MNHRISERESARQFWDQYKQECLSIKSIKDVFSRYKNYCRNHHLPILNEYIFRTYIRKHGYCNSK
jgi:hypothetical protein